MEPRPLHADDPTEVLAAARSGLRLELLTIFWMVIEAGWAVAAGVIAGSTLLTAFGIDSVIELLSAGVLLWRLRRELDGTRAHRARIESAERVASRISGWLLCALAAYVVGSAVYGILRRHHATTSPWGIALAVIAAVAMPLLARRKLRIADRIGSQALRADAMETFTCGYLSWVLLAGLIADALLAWWWVDAAASLLIVPLLLKEAKEAFAGECSCRRPSEASANDASVTDAEPLGDDGRRRLGGIHS